MAPSLFAPARLGLAVLALAAAAPSLKAQQPGPRAGLWVEDASGRLRRWDPSGERRAAQDARPAGARLAFLVETFARTATGALAANDLSAGRVLRALSGAGAPPGGVALEPPMVEPEYERPRVLARPGERRRLAGFRAVRVVEVRTERADRVALLVDLAVGAGATRVLEAGVDE
jgi:uncharacterized protein YggE